MSDDKDQKDLLRKKYISLRKKFKGSVEQKSQKIAQKLLTLDEIAKAGKISLYLPINNEVDTKQIIDQLTKRGVKIFLPKYFKKKDQYFFAEFIGWEKLENGSFNILEPRSTKMVDPDLIKVAIIPGVAFDRMGVRLGYGKGVFDRLLAGSGAFKIGLAYEFQIMDELPRDKHDLVMDLVVTEKRVILC